jgi:hypothetical protein
MWSLLKQFFVHPSDYQLKNLNYIRSSDYHLNKIVCTMMHTLLKTWRIMFVFVFGQMSWGFAMHKVYMDEHK